MATEFLTTVSNGEGGSGYDFGSMSECEGNFDDAGDYTATDLRVFSISGKTGTVSDGASVTGATSGATGTVIHVNYAQTQVLIDAISGTFSSGENVEVDASNYVTISDAGSTTIVYVCEFYSNGGAFAPADIDGATTDSSNYLEMRVAAGEEHNGVWGNGVRLNETAGTIWLMYTAYTRLIGFEINSDVNTTSSNHAALDLISGGNQWIVRNMIRCVNAGTGTCYGIRNRLGGVQYVIRNIFYETDSRGVHNDSFSNPDVQFYNNTCTSGVTDECIRHNDSTTGSDCVNNLSFSTGTSYDDCDGQLTTSGSNDTSGDPVGLDSLTCTNNLTSCSDPWNVHLVNTSADAYNAGTDVGTTPEYANIDIDGRDVDAEADTWDVGADEFVAAGATTSFLMTVY